jgi:hypothetical protein
MCASSLPVCVGSAFAGSTGDCERRCSRLTGVCRCGSGVTQLPPLCCMKCGLTCCSVCSHRLGSASFCTRCADSILVDGPPPTHPARGEPTARPSSGPGRTAKTTPIDASQWIILVAPDQPDLFAHLVESFARDDKVEVIMDRREDFHRNPPHIEERLRLHGVAVVKRCPR